MSEEPQTSPDIQVETDIAIHEKPKGTLFSSNKGVLLKEIESVDPDNDKYPYCIVWTAIPILTWLLPFVGHMGIADSRGITYDFAGSYAVNVDDFAFGKVARYVQLDPRKVDGGDESFNETQESAWDHALTEGQVKYSNKTHNLIINNCHHHVAYCLNKMKYNGKTNWNIVILAFWMFFFGKFVGIKGFLKTFLGFAILWTIVALVITAIAVGVRL